METSGRDHLKQAAGQADIKFLLMRCNRNLQGLCEVFLAKRLNLNRINPLVQIQRPSYRKYEINWNKLNDTPKK